MVFQGYMQWAFIELHGESGSNVGGMDLRTIRTEPAGAAVALKPRRHGRWKQRWLWRLLVAGGLALALYLTSGWWLARRGGGWTSANHRA